jgi:uncharacterized protein DUF4244
MPDHDLSSLSTEETTGAQAISDTPSRRPRRLFARQLLAGDDGMTTAEYAVGTVAACGFAGVLWAVVHSSTVAHLLSGVVARALQTTF